MRTQIVVGTESEYAVTAVDQDGRVLPVDVVIRQLRERVQTRPHLPGNESGLFLRNGARWYIDAGTHPEYAAPEATNPHEAVRYALAGSWGS
jgi:proteasome accessory factor A